MLRGLRLRLTLLYLLAALALVAVMGGGAYKLLDHYFQSTTDLALQHKMALQFRLLDAPLPPELAAADSAWYANQGRVQPQTPGLVGGSDGEQQDGASSEDVYDGELAAIFVTVLSADGTVIFDPNQVAPPLAPDVQAVSAALVTGYDWRTVLLSNGSRARLLTYRLTRGDGPAALQAGRPLADQDRILSQLLAGMLGLGSLSVIALGAGSWWLAGRSLVPAQRAWERQQAFVANASHELRTPLTLIRASAEVANRAATDPDARSLVDDILQECDHMTRLVEDLLLLSRLDAGRLTLERKAIPLPELLDDILRQMGRVADSRGVRLTADGVNGAVWGDPTRLRQVLLIFIDNALRHTQAGGAVQLRAHPRGKQIRIEISDSGGGIAPEHLPHVFERFYRARESRATEGGGTGLGLAIAKALVEAQQGKIHLESQIGKGTSAILILPKALEPAEGSGLSLGVQNLPILHRSQETSDSVKRKP